MEVHEKGCSQQMSNCWALLAGTIGSIYQIGEESSKKSISKCCKSCGMHVIHTRETLNVSVRSEVQIPMEDPHWGSL